MDTHRRTTVIAKRCPWIHNSTTTWTNVTRRSGLAARRGNACSLHRCSTLLTKLFAGNIVTARCTGCHGFYLSLVSVKLCTLFSNPCLQCSIVSQFRRGGTGAVWQRQRYPCSTRFFVRFSLFSLSVFVHIPSDSFIRVQRLNCQFYCHFGEVENTHRRPS